MGSRSLNIFYSNDFDQVAVNHYSSMFDEGLPNYHKASSIHKLKQLVNSCDSCFIFVAPYANDLLDIDLFRREYSLTHIFYVFLDPRSSRNLSFVHSGDLIIIDSLEQYDFCCSVTQKIFIYREYPLAPVLKPSTISAISASNPLRFLYHGNKRHLGNSRKSMILAFLRLKKLFPVELHLVYNISNLGKFPLDHDGIFHHQWSPTICSDIAPNMHVGLCPHFIPPRISPKLFASLWSRTHSGANTDDYLHRFKVPSNPGRLISNMRLGLASIADMTPSSCQFIRHDYDGYLVSSSHGWFHSMKSFIKKPSLISLFSERSQTAWLDYLSPQSQNLRLSEWLTDISKQANPIPDLSANK